MMAKPDDRSDNVERLRDAIDDTLENAREAEEQLRGHEHEMSGEMRAEILAKNERRVHAVQGFRTEIEDEAHRHDGKE